MTLHMIYAIIIALNAFYIGRRVERATINKRGLLAPPTRRPW